MLLSPPVAADLIKDLFNKRGSEEREVCHASPLSDKALCDSLNLFPASRTKPSCHGGPAAHWHGRFGTATAVPQLSGFLHPTNGTPSHGVSRHDACGSLRGGTAALQPMEFPHREPPAQIPSPLGMLVAEDKPEGLGWKISP